MCWCVSGSVCVNLHECDENMQLICGELRVSHTRLASMEGSTCTLPCSCVCVNLHECDENMQLICVELRVSHTRLASMEGSTCTLPCSCVHESSLAPSRRILFIGFYFLYDILYHLNWQSRCHRAVTLQDRCTFRCHASLCSRTQL